MDQAGTPTHSARTLAMVFALATASWAHAALSLDPSENFFTNIADRLLQQQLGVRLTEIQIAPTNQYDSAMHRIFQVTANIYDATSTNEFPAIFRPLFNATSNGVFLAGFTNDNRVSTLQSWLDSVLPRSLAALILPGVCLPHISATGSFYRIAVAHWLIPH